MNLKKFFLNFFHPRYSLGHPKMHIGSFFQKSLHILECLLFGAGEIWIVMPLFFRFLDGVADAASWAASVSILMKIFPKKVSTIMSWSEMLFGLGYMLGTLKNVLLTIFYKYLGI